MRILTEEEKRQLTREVVALCNYFAKLKANVIANSIPTITINCKNWETVSVTYPEDVKKMLAIIDERYNEYLKSLAKRYGVKLDDD